MGVPKRAAAQGSKLMTVHLIIFIKMKASIKKRRGSAIT
jgi:hypothetical protein